MNEKEVSEIRRRLSPSKSNINAVRGCYVNKNKEIVSEFNQFLGSMPEEEAENFLAIIKKTLSGTLNKNLIDIEFSNQQVVESSEHTLLMTLRKSELKDDDAVHTIFDKLIQSVDLDENYLILLTYDTYDVPYRSKDGFKQDDASSEVFSYILCSVCPVKMTKPALSYYAGENEFRSRTIDWIVSQPELGFMFPSFDDRSTNIYNALSYTRNIAENHAGFIESIFNQEAPIPAAEQRERFQSVLSSALENECDFETIQSVQESLQDLIEQHKENKEEVPLTISKKNVTQILESTGVSECHIQAFEENFDENFGADMHISPKNIVDTNQIKVNMPDVKIQVSGDRDDLIETRIIDGKKYVLILAEGEVELNGIPIHIS